MTHPRCRALILATTLVVAALPDARAETIRYDGKLFEQGEPASGLYDFRFRLFLDPAADPAAEVGGQVELDDVAVEAGRFTVWLDFGEDPPRESEAWLAVEVGRADRRGGFTVLEPLQPLAPPTPKAVQDSIPAGAVAFFELAACPPGWSEYGPAQGRAIVGLQPGGTLGGVQGVALTNLEARTHTHLFSAQGTTASGGAHNHVWARITSVSGGVQWSSFDYLGTEFLVYSWTNGIDNAGSGIYPLTANPSQSLYTDMEAQHTHAISLPETPTSTTSGTLPYLQLRACRKD